MRRGNYIYCVGSIPLLYAWLSGLNVLIGIFICVSLLSLIIVLFVKALKKDWSISPNLKAWAIVVLSAIIYTSVNLLTVAWLLPRITNYSDNQLYLLSFVWLAIVVIATILIIKKCLTKELNFWCRLIVFIALIMLVAGTLFSIQKIKETNAAKKQAAVQSSNTFNQSYFSSTPDSGCSGFKLY